MRVAIARLAFGSDLPIVSAEPLFGIEDAVAGPELNRRPFVNEHSISLRGALAGYTRTAAQMLDLPSDALAATTLCALQCQS